jgi:O-antigen/teichoic acid export membrane protein
MENKTEDKVVSKENHKQRAFLNSITSVIDQISKQITGFLVSPFIVNGLGNKFYGIYQILIDLTSYAQMADIRITQVLKWTVAQKRDIASERELQEEVTTAFLITLIILPFIIVFGAGISWFAPTIANVSEEYFTLIRLVTSLMIFSLIIYKVMDVFESLLRGMNLGFKGMGIRSLFIIFSGVLKVIAIKLNYGLIGLAGVQILTAFLLLFIFYFLVKRNIPWFKITRTNTAKLIEYTKLSGWFMLSTILNLALLNSDKIILGYLVGPEIVTLYVLTFFTSSAMRGIVDSFISGVVPGIGSFFGKKEFEKIVTAQKIISSIIWITGFSIGVSIMLFNESFLNLWVGTSRYAGNLENLLIIFIAIQHSFFSSSSAFINVTLDLRFKVLLIALASITTIGLSFLLVPTYQILGTVISILFGRSILVVGYILILNSKMNIKTELKDLINLRPSITTLVVLVVAMNISPMLKIESWIELISYGLLTSIGLFFVFWFIGIEKENKVLLYNKISTINLKKFSK